MTYPKWWVQYDGDQDRIYSELQADGPEAVKYGKLTKNVYLAAVAGKGSDELAAQTWARHLELPDLADALTHYDASRLECAITKALAAPGLSVTVKGVH